MILLWTVRYFDRNDKQFKNRNLYLDTKSLDPITQATVELVTENQSFATAREILKYRHLFEEERPENRRDSDTSFRSCGGALFGYIEDETGKEISEKEMSQILTGTDTAQKIPLGLKQHDLDYMRSEPTPISFAETSLTPEDLRLLGYFLRDLRELQSSAFMKDGPGSLKCIGLPVLSSTSNPTLETAVSDEEIRSFVTIFRRLYMQEKEPASFVKIVPITVKAMGDNPLSKWVVGAAEEYQRHLGSVPDSRPFIPLDSCTFPTKRLIDVFLYTQYAHQPCHKRQRQFEECLVEVQGELAVLTWMFFTEIWKLSLKIESVGKVIDRWFKQYCDHHNVVPDILNSLREHHTGLGVIEKKEDRKNRLFKEKVEQLAIALWEVAGRPDGGHTLFIAEANHQLSKRMSED